MCVRPGEVIPLTILGRSAHAKKYEYDESYIIDYFPAASMPF